MIPFLSITIQLIHAPQFCLGPHAAELLRLWRIPVAFCGAIHVGSGAIYQTDSSKISQIL